MAILNIKVTFMLYIILYHPLYLKLEYLPVVALVSRASPFTREEGSGQLRIMSLCCRVSSGQAVQGVSSNSMLFAVSRDAVLAGLFGARHTGIPSMHMRMCTVSMRYECMHSMHELLHVDARHLWLTRQENRGKRSQNHDAKLTRPFLRVGRGWLARL